MLGPVWPLYINISVTVTGKYTPGATTMTHPVYFGWGNMSPHPCSIARQVLFVTAKGSAGTPLAFKAGRRFCTEKRRKSK